MNGAANLNNGIHTRAIFTPFLVDSADLDGGDEKNQYQLLKDIFVQPINAELVSNLTMLYKTYYPRVAKVSPLSINQAITITWELTTAPSGNDSVSTVHALR